MLQLKEKFHFFNKTIRIILMKLYVCFKNMKDSLFLFNIKNKQCFWETILNIWLRNFLILN